MAARRTNLATLNAATVTPKVAKPGTKATEPKATLAESLPALVETITAGLSRAKVTGTVTAADVETMLVGQARAALVALAAEITTAAKGLSAESVTLKPKGETGRVVVCISPDVVDGVWSQGTVSITLDGVVGTGVRAIFPGAE